MEYKEIDKFLKSSLCLTIIFLILTQPCLALGFLSFNPTPTPHTNFTTQAEFLNYHQIHLVGGIGLNRLDLKTYPDATTVDYLYDLGSRLTSIEDQGSSIEYSYDNLNRVTQATTNWALVTG